MSIELNHTIARATAGPFRQVQGANGIVYFADPDGRNMELLTRA